MLVVRSTDEVTVSISDAILRCRVVRRGDPPAQRSTFPTAETPSIIGFLC